METKDIIKGLYCSCNHINNNLLVINEDKQNKLNKPIYIVGGSNFYAASFLDMAYLQRSIKDFSLDIETEPKRKKYL